MPSDAQAFADRAVGQQVESRLIGEGRWWPTSAEEAAQILGAYALSLDDVFDRLCAGQVVASPISEFRFVTKPD
jgi:hypothetical protein